MATIEGTEGTDLLNGTLCSCGNPIAAHKCPSSSGAAPRAPKTASCRACGEKAHQNLERTTVALECLYRQWAKATGQLSVTPSNRLVMPDVTSMNVQMFAQWLAGQQQHTASGQLAPAVATATPNGGYQIPDTAAVLKRMQARAATAAPMPDEHPQEDGEQEEAPFQQDVADIVAAHDAAEHPATFQDAYLQQDFDPTDLSAPIEAPVLAPPPEITDADLSDIF